MGSIKYEILRNGPWEKPDGNAPTSNTIEQYKTQAIRFGKWAKKQYGCQSYADISAHSLEYIQAYCDDLVAKKRKASTVRTYAAALCYVWGHKMEAFKLPFRHCYENTRSRGDKASDSRNDTKREVSPRLYDFAAAVGIRRAEYQHLLANNLKLDESGYLCVEVLKGKGGKYQLQRILTENVDFVRPYFNGSEAYVFSKAELKNKIDLHHLRAVNAKRAYAYYIGRLCSEPEYRAQLEREIEARWKLYRGVPPKGSKHRHNWDWNPDNVRGAYHIRGKNKAAAIENGFETTFDRLAVMAVSVFHLSHWRCDVAINHYLLAN